MIAKSVPVIHDGQPVKAMLSHDGLIVLGANGRLRLYDPPHHVCHGKQNGCRCTTCETPRGTVMGKTSKTKTFPPNTIPKRCECEKPINNEGTCLSCGKPIERLKSVA